VPESVPEPLVADADRAETPDSRGNEARWLRGLAFGTASAVVAFGAVGLVTAIAGVYRTYVVFPVGALVWIGLLALARPLLVAPGAASRTTHLVAGAGVVFVGAMSLWNIRHASQHVLINRDGGAYTNAGRWIAMHGNLRVVAAVGPFARQPALTFGSFGMYPSRGGTLSFQFAHLLPALLAEAHNLGGDRLMFAATPLLSGVALLAFFVAAWRLVRNPFVALTALVSFAFLLPEVSFSRDTYSEIPMQVLIFTGLWILVDRAAFRRPRLALVAGLVLGMLQAARIDALAALTGLAPLFAVLWLVADARDRRSVALSGAALGIGLVPGVVLGFADVALRSYGYLHDLRSDVKLLVAAIVASFAVAAVLVIVVPPVARRIRRVPSWVAPVAGAGVGLVGFGLWFLRPRLQHVHGVPNPLVGGLQEAARVAVDPTRTYAERTMTWMSWYLGPLTVAAAIVAAALLVWMLVRGRLLFTLAGIALLGPSSAIYLWRPNISSDQIWVMRRYLFSALPLLTLLAFGLVAALVDLVPRRLPRVVPVVCAVVIAAGAVVFPIAALKPVRNMTEQRGNPLAVRDACRTMGEHAAVVLLQSPTGLLSEWAPQTLRGWCNVPVAVMAPTVPDRAAELERLAAQWAKLGRTLWVVADGPATIHSVLPAATIHHTPVVTNPYFLERSLLRRPSHYAPEPFSLVLAPVPVPAS
jgi:hypothetical protein